MCYDKTIRMRKRFIANSARDLDVIIKQWRVGQEDFSADRKTAWVIALTGNIGAGKTSFTQRFLKQLGAKRKVISPSFVLMRDYQLKNGLQAYHLDAWRISAKEFKGLKIKDLFKNPKNIILVEWAEKVKAILPQDALWIEFEHLGGNKRRVKFSNPKH